MGIVTVKGPGEPHDLKIITREVDGTGMPALVKFDFLLDGRKINGVNGFDFDQMAGDDGPVLVNVQLVVNSVEVVQEEV